VSFKEGPGLLRANGNERLGLEVTHGYRIVEAQDERGPWKVKTAAYMYTLKDDQGHELIAFHWHPEGRSDVQVPHLHLGLGLQLGRKELLKAHIPTGRIALEQVIRFAVETFGVGCHRTDWAKILDRNQRVFDTWKTWS
jgi:hypothetical protein